MHIVYFFRSLLTMILLPLLTLLASLLAILLGGIFRLPPRKLQWIPRIIWARVLCWTNGVTVTVRGLEKLDPKRSYIFAANHQSQFDIFSLQGYLGFDFRWMAKKELFKIPFFGLGMRLAGYIPVDRGSGRQAIKSLDEAAKKIADGTSVIIFPEGTRSLDGELHPFKAGGMVLAIKAGVPVVPLAISGTYEVLPKGRLLAKPAHVVINIGEPIETSSYAQKDKHALAEKLQGLVAGLKKEADAVRMGPAVS